MKLASETCRFPFRERHKRVKQEELAHLAFKPCGKILFASGRGSINQRRIAAFEPLCFLTSQSFGSYQMRDVGKDVCAHTTAAGKGIVATRKKGFFIQPL